MRTQREKIAMIIKSMYLPMILSLALAASLDYRYWSTCPREPDVESGHIYPLDNRGKFVYLTAGENRNVNAAKDLLFVIWIFYGALQVTNWSLGRPKPK